MQQGNPKTIIFIQQRKILLRQFILLLLILTSTYATISAQQYNFIKYNVQEGLPQSQVYDLYQDSKSYLWMATQGGGVCSFDGANFNTLTMKDGLPSNYVHTIYEDQENTIWFGTKKGLAKYKQQEISFGKPEERIIYAIAPQTDSTLWLGTDKGLYTFNKRTKKYQKHRVDAKLNIARVNDLLQVKNELWIASTRGLFILKDNTIELIDINDGLLSDDIKDLHLDKKGQVWIAQFAGGLTRISARRKQIQKSYYNANLRMAQNVYLGKENMIWVGTQDKGIQVLNATEDTWETITEKVGLAHNNVQSILSDHWGNVWIATSGGGVNKFLGQYFTHFNSNTGLNGNRIYAVAEDNTGAIWMSVDDKGVSVIDSSGIRTDIDEAYIDSKCNHIMQDSEERMWMSTAGGGLVMKDSAEYWVFNELDGLPSNWIKTTIQDTLGYIWVGTYANGLGRLVSVDSLGIKVELYDTNSGLPDPFITVLAKDRLGKIWFGTKQGGIGYIDGFNIVSAKPNSGLPNTGIRSIAFDASNQIWIGTAGRGLYQSESIESPLKFKRWNADKSLTSDNIYQLIFDQEENLWVGSELGIDKIEFDKDQFKSIQHFGKNEGFLGIETCHNSTTLDSDGNLWFGTLNGLSKHKPGETQLKVAPPKIHFTEVSLMYKPISDTEYAHFAAAGDSLSPSTLFKHSHNNIGFGFQAVNLDYPTGMSYVWKLAGHDEDWSPASKSEAINFTNLSPGKYRFMAKALNKAGLESEAISTQFEIKHAIWQLRWFQILVLAVLGLLAFLFFSAQIKKVKKKEAARRAQLELENELLSLEQKALQLQMNPHFIFNALNSIQSVVVTQKTDVARDQIQNFAGLMRGILTNSKKQRITLQEEYDTIDKYLKLEQFCQNKPFDFEIHLPDNHDPDEIEIPPMMIQPFVENAVFHGVSHLEVKGLIKVVFKIENEILSCEIIDNGVGRKKAKSMSTQKAGHQSVALEVTRQRLESLRGANKYTAFSIDDVLNEAGEVRGTKVSLKLPLQLTF